MMRLAWAFGLVLLASCAVPEPAADEDCSSSATDGDGWAVDPDGPDGQIHPRTVRHGDRLWTAYNRPDEDGAFTVWLAAHGCDGEERVAPMRLDTGDGNATDPDLAVTDDGVFVVWQRDFADGPFNLSVRWARVDADGTLLNADEEFVFQGEAAPLAGQAWMARVASGEDGWWVVAARANQGGVFHPVVQRTDSSGAADGPAKVAGSSEEEGFEPSIAATARGVVVGWQKSFDGSSGYGMAEVGEDVTPLAWDALDVPGVGISVAWDGVPQAAMGRGADVAYGSFGDVTTEVSGGVGFAQGVDLRLDAGTPYLAWNEGPATTATVFGVFGAGPETRLVDGVGGYAASVVPIGDGVVVVTTADGQSPEFRLRSRVVRLDSESDATRAR